MIGQHPMDKINHVERHAVGIQLVTQCPVNILKMPSSQQGQISARLQNSDDLTACKGVEAP